jgi:hypothetical protein
MGGSPLLTPYSHGKGAPAICRELPDGQTKAEQQLHPRNFPFKKKFQGKQLPAYASASHPVTKNIQINQCYTYPVYCHNDAVS